MTLRKNKAQAGFSINLKNLIILNIFNFDTKMRQMPPLLLITRSCDISSTLAADFRWKKCLCSQLKPCWKRSDVISPIFVVAQQLALHQFGNFLTFQLLYLAVRPHCARVAQTGAGSVKEVGAERGTAALWWKICVDVLGNAIWEPRRCDFISTRKLNMTEYENTFMISLNKST